MPGVGLGLVGLDAEGAFRFLVHTRDEPEVREDEDVARPGHGDEEFLDPEVAGGQVGLEDTPRDRGRTPLARTPAVAVGGHLLVDAQARVHRQPTILRRVRPDRRVGIVVARRRHDREGTQALDRVHADGLGDVHQANVAHERIIDLVSTVDALELDRVERTGQFTLVDLPSDPDAVAPVAALAGVLLVVGDVEHREGVVAGEQEVEGVGPVVRLALAQVADLVDRDLVLAGTQHADELRHDLGVRPHPRIRKALLVGPEALVLGVRGQVGRDLDPQDPLVILDGDVDRLPSVTRLLAGVGLELHHEPRCDKGTHGKAIATLPAPPRSDLAKSTLFALVSQDQKEKRTMEYT